MRNRCRAITRAMRFYPGSKLFAHLVSSLTSKNARTRAECLVEMTYLIERNGLNVCSPSKSLPLVAAQISDRDSSVRTAALNTIVQAYAVVGENVFKYLGRLSDKDRSLLDERIKRSKVVAPVGIATASPTRPQTRTSVYEEKPGLDARERQAIVQEHASTVASANNKFSLDLDKLNLPKLSGAGMQPPPAAVPLSPTSRNSAPPSGTSEYVIDYLLTQITSGDMYQSIDALKSLDKNMRTNMDQVRQQINPLVNAINLQVRLAFTSTGVATSDQSTLARLCRMLVGSLMNIVTDEQLAVAISRETLHQLLGELLMRLVHQGLNNVTETGAQLVRSLNALMLRLLENCNTNHMFR